MNRTVLIGLCGVVVGLASGIVSSSRVAVAQARSAGLQRQDAQCVWTTEDAGPRIGASAVLRPFEFNDWIAATTRAGWVLMQPTTGGPRAVFVCVTRPAP